MTKSKRWTERRNGGPKAKLNSDRSEGADCALRSRIGLRVTGISPVHPHIPWFSPQRGLALSTMHVARCSWVMSVGYVGEGWAMPFAHLSLAAHRVREGGRGYGT